MFLLDLSNNRFNGRIPYDLERLQGYAIYLSNQYHYSFEIQEIIKGIEYNFPYISFDNTKFDLYNNNPTVEIPVSMGV